MATKTPEEMAFDSGKTAVEAILAAYPLLSDYGHGWPPRDQKEIQPSLEQYRKDLLSPTSVKTITKLANWMEQNLKKRKTINKMRSSYGLKHKFAEVIGYVTNGQFITAALIAGFGMDSDRPNPHFNMKYFYP